MSVKLNPLDLANAATSPLVDHRIGTLHSWNETLWAIGPWPKPGLAIVTVGVE